MPLYLYRCEDCEGDFETLVTRQSQNTVVCPSCSSAKVVRSFGVPAKVTSSQADLPTLNCRGDGPPCGAIGCGRMNTRA